MQQCSRAACSFLHRLISNLICTPSFLFSSIEVAFNQQKVYIYFGFYLSQTICTRCYQLSASLSHSNVLCNTLSHTHQIRHIFEYTHILIIDEDPTEEAIYSFILYTILSRFIFFPLSVTDTRASSILHVHAFIHRRHSLSILVFLL